MINIAPSHKDDILSVENLRQCSIQQIKREASKLLEWLQDMNWPVARPLAEVLKEYTNYFVPEITEVLRSNDDLWKYWIIQELILGSKYAVDRTILDELKRIINNPTIGEQEEEVVEIAIEAINHWQEK